MKGRPDRSAAGGLPADQVAMLREVCRRLTDPAGREGLIVLFVGPDYRARTTAVEALGHSLDRRIQSVDGHGLVGKYIGETEKNLARILDGADARDAILFFDEADALFGRRTEVKDSHGRHANQETGHLLDRLEEFQGLVILATNQAPDLDQEARKRVDFYLDFPSRR